jgi:hypothetical protein
LTGFQKWGGGNFGLGDPRKREVGAGSLDRILLSDKLIV